MVRNSPVTTVLLAAVTFQRAQAGPRYSYHTGDTAPLPTALLFGATAHAVY